MARLKQRLDESEERRVAETEELKTAIAIDRTARSMQPESPTGSGSAFDRMAKRRQSASGLGGVARRKSIAPRGLGAEQGGSQVAMQEEIEQLQSSNRQLKSANLSLGTETKQQQVEISKLTQQLEGVTKKLRSFESKHRVSLQSIEALQKDKVRLENELKETRRLKHCADKGQEKVKSLSDGLKEEKKAHQRLLDELRDATERNQQISQDLAATLAINEDQKRRMEIMVAELAQIQEDNEKLRQDCLGERAQLESQQSELELAQEQQAELQQQIELHEKKYLALKKTSDDQAAALEQAELTASQVSHQLDLQKQENASNLTSLEQLRGANRSLVEAQAELRRLQGEHELLSKRYAEGLEPFERSKLRIAELEDQHQQQLAKIRQMEQALADFQSGAARELNEVKNSHSRKQGALKKQLTEQQGQLRDQEAELLEAKLLIERSKKEIDRQKRQSMAALSQQEGGHYAKEEREGLIAQIGDLQSRLRQLESHEQEATKLALVVQEKDSLIKEMKQRLATEMARTGASGSQEKENPEGDLGKLRSELTTQKANIRKYKKNIHDLMSMIKALQASQIDAVSAMKQIEEERAALQTKLDQYIHS